MEELIRLCTAQRLNANALKKFIRGIECGKLKSGEMRFIRDF